MFSDLNLKYYVYVLNNLLFLLSQGKINIKALSIIIHIENLGPVCLVSFYFIVLK